MDRDRKYCGAFRAMLIGVSLETDVYAGAAIFRTAVGLT